MAISKTMRSGRMWPYPTLCGQAECGHIRHFAVRQNVAISDTLRSSRMWPYPTLCGQAECGHTRHFVVRQNVALSDTLRSDRTRPYSTLYGQADVAISDALRSGFAIDSIAACFNPKASSRFDCVCVCVCVTGACWGREKEEAGTTTTSDSPRASECAWGAKQRSAQEPREWRRWG